MKTINLVFFILIFSSFFCACVNNERINNYYTVRFDRNDFKERKDLRSLEKIEIKDALNPHYCYLVKDSLMLISNRDNSQLYKAGLYSLNTGKLIKELAPKGNGPQEFIDCTLDVRENMSDIFYIEDVIQNKYWVCSIDSILQNKNYLLRSFTYSRDVIRLCPLDEDYIGYNFWYLNNDEFDNQVPVLDKYEMTNAPKARLGSGHDYFVANVTGGYVFTNKKHKTFWVSNFFDDKIDIYNDSLQLIKCLQGPDYFEQEYKEVTENDYNYIFFLKGTSYQAYLAYTLTPDHIYLVYEGTNGTPYRINNLKKVEIFKLDWDGNLLCDYQLDKHAFAISVDSKEEFLYAACYEAYDGDIELYKYKL